MKLNIQTIKQVIMDTTHHLPDLDRAAGDAISAISASEGRAGLKEKRLSAAAKYSIAVAAMRFVSATVKSSGNADSIIINVKKILNQLSNLKPNTEQRHDKTDRPDIPSEWYGAEKGPWFLDNYKNHHLSVMHTRNMPGGNWTVTIHGIPCLYGEDVNEVIKETKALIDAISSSKKSDLTGNKNPFQKPF